MSAMYRHMRWVVLAAVVVIASLGAVANGAIAMGGGGVVSGRAAPVWFTSDTVGGARINMVMSGNAPGTFVFGADVARPPVLLTHGGVRTLVVFESPGGARPVRALGAEFGPGDRLLGVDLETLASLPGDGTLAGVVSSEQGDFALMRGLQFPLSTDEASSFAQGPALVRLGSSRWERAPLPTGIDGAHEWRLVLIGATPAIVEHRAPERARVWIRSEDGEWDAQVWSIPRDAREIVGVSGGVIVERYEGERAEFSFVRGESVAGRGIIEGCPGDHSFAVLGDRIVVCGVDRSGKDAQLYSAWLGRDGSVEHAGELRPVSPISRRDVETLVALIASASLTMILFLLRIGHEGARVIRIPRGYSIAPTWKRAGAAMIDLVPALMAVLILWPTPEQGASMADLTMAYGPWPPVTVGAIMFAHSTIGEWMFGRTLGKAIAGCRTVSTKTGRRPTFMQAAGRNFVKVACPPLGMVQAMTPGREEPWGFATTVVVRQDAGPDDGGDGAGDSGSSGANRG